MEQNYIKRKYGIGNFAIWLLIYLELTEFAVFFVVFLIGKSHYPEIFFQGPTKLNTMAGMFNTLILITGSFFIARAVAAIKQDQREKTILFLWLTFLMGLLIAWLNYGNINGIHNPVLTHPAIISTVFTIRDLAEIKVPI